MVTIRITCCNINKLSFLRSFVILVQTIRTINSGYFPIED